MEAPGVVSIQLGAFIKDKKINLPGDDFRSGEILSRGWACKTKIIASLWILTIIWLATILLDPMVRP